MGAPDPRAGTPAASPTHALSAASRDWWSLRPLANALIPTTRPARSGWARNPIDAFILAKLEEKKLGPASEADRRHA